MFNNVPSETTFIAHFLAEVPHTANTTILGTENNKGQRIIPYNVLRKIIGIICLVHNRIQKSIRYLDNIIQLVIPEGEMRNW